MNKNCENKTTAHIQNILYVDDLHNIKRKKYKLFVQNWHSPKSPSTEWSWFFLHRTCNIFFICYAVGLLQYSVFDQK
jgi:hypothetical protein